MSDVFDIARSEWEINISEEELKNMWQVISGPDVTVYDDVVWLTAEPSGLRTWTFCSSECSGWFTSIGLGTTEVCYIPFTRLFLVNIMELIVIEKQCTVYYNANEDAIVVRLGDRVVFGDYPRKARAYSKELFLESKQLHNKSGVRVEFDAHTFRSFIHPMCYAPFGIDFSDAMISPNTLWSVTPDQVRATRDWTRFGSTCITTVVDVPATGCTQFSLNIILAWKHWGDLKTTDDVTIIYDESKPDFVHFSCGTLGLKIPMVYDEIERWHHPLITQIFAEDYELCSAATGHLSNDIVFTSNDIELTAHIVTRDSDENDRIRLSMLLSGFAGDNEATLREINHLNNTVVDARLVLQDEKIFAIIDFPAHKMRELSTAVDRLLQIKQQHRGLDALFASIV